MKGVKIIQVIFVCSLFIRINFISAQGTQVDPLYKSDVIPPSPEVQAFTKYGEYSFNIQKGVPSIQIPIYTVTEGMLSLPISISYDAGGIRTDQVPTCVGLGWILNTGGILSRTINGAPDEDELGFMSPTFSPYLNKQPWEDVIHFRSMATGEKDSKPDIFSYSYPGAHGKFLYNNRQQIQLFPPSGHLITPIWNAGILHSWKVVDVYGNFFVFSDKEVTDIVSNNGWARDNNITGWYLNSIRSVNGADKIDLEYISYEYPIQLNVSQKRLERDEMPLNSNYTYFPERLPVMESWSNQQIKGKLIHKIISTNETVQFFYSTNENFYTSATGIMTPKKLDSIVIYSNHSTRVKKYQFNYDYFTSSNEKRLKLTELIEYGNDGTAIPPYIFTYNNSMTTFLSKSKDHWGFYNAAGNPNLLPGGYFCTSGLIYADRSPHATAILMGILNKIIYPTGGSTTFEYEPNDYSYIGRYENSVQLGEKQSMGRFITLNQRQPSVEELLNTPEPYQTSEIFTLTPKTGWDIDLCILPNSGNNYLVPVTYYIDKCIHSTVSATVELAIKNIATQSVVWRKNNSSNCMTISPVQGIENIELPAGSYELSITMQPNGNIPGNVNYLSDLTIGPVETFTSVDTKLGGGVRIKRITQSPSEGKNIVSRTFIYKDNPSDSKSSGLLNGKINYLSLMDKHAYCNECCNCNYDRPVGCPLVPEPQPGCIIEYTSSCLGIDIYHAYYVLQSNALGEPIHHMGYRTVYEYFGTESNNTGYIKHEYSVEPYSSFFSGNGLNTLNRSNPFLDFQWANGLQKKETIYSNAGQNKLIKEYEYFGNPMQGIRYWSLGMKQNDSYIVNLPCEISSAGKYFEYEQPTIYNLKKDLVKLVTTTFDDLGNSMQQTEYTFYDNSTHYQPRLTAKKLSDGKYISTRYLYTGDIPAASGTSDPALIDILAIKSKNALALPIEEIAYYCKPSGTITFYPGTDDPDAVLKSSGLNAKVISAQFLLYNSLSIQPSSWWRLRVDQPIAAASYNPVTVTNNQLIKHSKYEKHLTINYNGDHKLSEEILPDSIGNTFLWGHRSKLPVANIIGARENQCFATSFETPGKFSYNDIPILGSNISPAKTGFYYYSGNIMANNLPAGEYTLSLWTRGSASSLSVTNGSLLYESAPDAKGWKYAEYYLNLSNISNISISGNEIDEVRLFPYNAQMTTFSYDDKLKLMDVMPPDGQVERYTYDGLMRLKAIYDHNRYLRKEFEYHYGF